MRTLPTGGHPIVYGEWLGAPGKKTIVVYGHYDVQPPDPLEKWASPPWTPTLRDGRLYARGVSDDKGPMLIPIAVAAAFFATAGRLPINVKFLFEGEEEIGSRNLDAFVREHADLLAADVVVSADGAMWRIDEPSLTVASRGLCGLELTLRAAAKDLHSGRHGGGVANPLHAMAALIASLHDADGRVRVDGFYDDVRDLLPRERAALAALPFDERAYVAQIGALSSFGEAGYTTLERLWTRPTLDVNGMWGGYQGPGQKTVIPSEAHAKITCRLVSDQRPDDVAERVRRHLEMHVPSSTRLSVSIVDHGSRAAQIPADHFALKAADAALAATYGVRPLVVRMGGTVPISDLFQRHMGIDTVFFSFSTADGGPPSPVCARASSISDSRSASSRAGNSPVVPATNTPSSSPVSSLYRAWFPSRSTSPSLPEPRCTPRTRFARSDARSATGGRSSCSAPRASLGIAWESCASPEASRPWKTATGRI